MLFAAFSFLLKSVESLNISPGFATEVFFESQQKLHLFQ